MVYACNGCLWVCTEEVILTLNQSEKECSLCCSSPPMGIYYGLYFAEAVLFMHLLFVSTVICLRVGLVSFNPFLN